MTTVPCWEIRIRVHDLDSEVRDKLSDAIFDLAYAVDPAADGVCTSSERGCISCSTDPFGPDAEEYWVGPHGGALWLMHACPGADPEHGAAVVKFGGTNTEDDDPVGMAAEGMDILLAAMNSHTCKPTKGAV